MCIVRLLQGTEQRLKRSEKIRLSAAVAQKQNEADTRTPEDRDAARREWGQIRKAAREAFLAGNEWQAVLESFKERNGFYTPEERERLCSVSGRAYYEFSALTQICCW